MTSETIHNSRFSSQIFGAGPVKRIRVHSTFCHWVDLPVPFVIQSSKYVRLMLSIIKEDKEESRDSPIPTTPVRKKKPSRSRRSSLQKTSRPNNKSLDNFVAYRCSTARQRKQPGLSLSLQASSTVESTSAKKVW
jgi:hypothetical protein